MSGTDDLSAFPILGPRTRGQRQQHQIRLPYPALADDAWTVTSLTGSEPGPAIFINAGVHGAEYPAIQTVIELGGLLDPARLRGTVVLMPVVNLPGFRQRSMFVCPVDGKNPNRMFPGTPDGSYSQQLAHALMTHFITQAGAHIDLHGGDMVEALIPFSICQAGDTHAATMAFQLATGFGLPYLLVVDRPIQPASGTTTCAAAAAAGIPSFIAEAGGIGLLEPEPVRLLRDGVLRVLGQLGMIDDAPAPAPEPVVLSSFKWLYTPVEGLFYPAVAVGDDVNEGSVVGTVGTLTGEQIAEMTAPVSGKVLFQTTSPAMQENGLLMGIGVA
jgi:predicted deacylase